MEDKTQRIEGGEDRRSRPRFLFPPPLSVFGDKSVGRACPTRSGNDNASSFHGLKFLTIGEAEAAFVGVEAAFTVDHQHVATDLEHVLREFRKTGSGPDPRRHHETSRGRLSGTRRFQVRLILGENFMPSRRDSVDSSVQRGTAVFTGWIWYLKRLLTGWFRVLLASRKLEFLFFGGKEWKTTSKWCFSRKLNLNGNNKILLISFFFTPIFLLNINFIGLRFKLYFPWNMYVCTTLI